MPDFSSEDRLICRCKTGAYFLSFDRPRIKLLALAMNHSESIINHLNAIVFSFDKDGIFTSSAGKGLELLGLKPGQVVGMSVFDVYKDEPSVIEDCKSALKGEPVRKTVYVGDLAFDSSFTPVLGKNGELKEVVGISINVSNYKQTEAELSKQQEKLKRVITASNTGIWEWNIANDEVYYSPKWKEILGYTDDELENAFNTWTENLHPDEKDDLQEKLQDFLNNPVGHFEQTFRMKHKKGHYVWILNRSAITLGDNGKPIYMSGSHLDISDILHKEAELDASEYKFRTVFERSPLGKSMTGIDGTLKTNKAFSEILGYSKEELQEKHWKEYTHPQDIEASERFVKQMIDGEINTARFEKRYLHKEGHYIWTEVNTSLYRDNTNKPLFFITSILDITDRKKKNEELKLKNIVYNTSVAANSMSNINGELRSVNNSFLKIWGYESPEEVLGRSISEFIKFKNEATEILNGLTTKGEWSGTYTALRKDGSTFMARAIASTLNDEEGNAIGYQSSVFDISEMIEAENKTKASEKKFKTLFQTSTIPLCNVDNEGRIILINDQFTKTFGYTLEDVPTLDDWWNKAYPDEEYREWVLKTWGEAIENAKAQDIEIRSEEYTVTCKNGLKRIVIIGGTNLEDGFLASFIDVTERKEMEEKLKNSNKELEQFAYISSHDLQEPLRKIKSYSELFELKYKEIIDEKGD